MSKKLILKLLTVAFFSMFFIQSHLSAMDDLDDAAELECNNGTVVVGDSEDSVRAKCGNPQKVSQRDVDSPIIWFYNFGPTEFVYYVTFTDGIVERIQVGGYGD